MDEAIAQYQEQLKKQQAQQAQQEPMKTETLKTAEPLPTMGAEEKVDIPAEQLEPKITVVPTVTPTAVPTVEPTKPVEPVVSPMP